MVQETTEKANTCAFGRMQPKQVIALSLGIAFLVFVLLDFFEQLVFPSGLSLSVRLAHFLRGFIATTLGMVLVWLVMHRKEDELSGLRDHFAEQLSQRTTELQNLARDREADVLRQEAILASMGEAVIVIGEDGRITSTNREAAQTLGIGESTIGRRATEIASRFIPVKNAAMLVSLSAALSDGLQHSSNDALYQHPDGRKLIVSWTISPVIIDQRNLGQVLTVSDVTERRELQLALMQQREDFLAVINHRLRNPILASERAASLLLQGDFGDMAPPQKEIVNLILDNNSELDRLLNSLMDIYRYRNGSTSLETVDVGIHELLADVFARLQQRAADRRVGLHEIQLGDAVLRCDSKEVIKLLSHIVENAIKHARSDVSVSCSKRKDRAVISITDDGRGIAPEDVPTLFDRFYSMSTEGKYAAVTGTGLCLCNEIVKAHNGKISCTSSSESGTTFTIELPLAEAQEECG